MDQECWQQRGPALGQLAVGRGNAASRGADGADYAIRIRVGMVWT